MKEKKNYFMKIFQKFSDYTGEKIVEERNEIEEILQRKPLLVGWYGCFDPHWISKVPFSGLGKIGENLLLKNSNGDVVFLGIDNISDLVIKLVSIMENA